MPKIERVPEEHIKNVCKRGTDTCPYLMQWAGGKDLIPICARGVEPLETGVKLMGAVTFDEQGIMKLKSNLKLNARCTGNSTIAPYQPIIEG